MPRSQKPDNDITTDAESLIPTSFYTIFKQERVFIGLVGIFFFIAGVTFPYAKIAMWVGFALAGYSAIANDSIQTIGTFLASNQDKKWWVLWLYIGGIFLVTVTTSWLMYDGDVSHQRLAAKGFDKAPTEFVFLQVAAPIFLLILTRMRMPVSTTFLILSSFAASTNAIEDVLKKSLSGYVVAFVSAIIVWLLLSKVIRKYFTGKAAAYWMPLQWLTSGMLWSVWIMQDAANIAVYLPRQLSVGEFLAFSLYIFFGLGLLFYLRGDRIQQIVTEKSEITDVRAATLVDFVYSIIMYYFKYQSKVPMSTTWVFLGLLAGREIAMSITDGPGKGSGNGVGYAKAFRMIIKDVSYALIGLIISIILAAAINPNIREDIIKLVGY